MATRFVWEAQNARACADSARHYAPALPQFWFRGSGRPPRAPARIGSWLSVACGARNRRKGLEEA